MAGFQAFSGSIPIMLKAVPLGHVYRSSDGSRATPVASVAPTASTHLTRSGATTSYLACGIGATHGRFRAKN